VVGVSRRRVIVRSPAKVTVAVPRREPPPTSRARFPFLATITRRDGLTCEVEVTERGMRFVRWLPHTTRNGAQGATTAPQARRQGVDAPPEPPAGSGVKSCP
jgi:hypothetical protein